MNYYPDVDKFFKEMYFLNRLWFERRKYLTSDQLQKLFEVREKAGQHLVEARQLLNMTQPHGDAREVKRQIQAKGYYQDSEVTIQ